jgi:hypothetical protein
VNNPLILISGYFVGLFFVVMVGSRIHRQIGRRRKDSKRPLITEIEKVEAARQQILAGR